MPETLEVNDDLRVLGRPTIELADKEEPSGEQKQESKESEPEKKKKEKKDPRDAESVPMDRFREVVSETKILKHQIEETEKRHKEEMASIAAGYQEVRAALYDIKDKSAVENMPDPTENPKEYAMWVNEQIELKAKRHKDVSPVPTPPVQPTPQSSQTDALQEVERSIHSDYDEVVTKYVNPKISGGDKALNDYIFSQPNPYRTAYEYGKRIKDLEKTQRAGLEEQGYVEGATNPVIDDKPELSQRAKRLAKTLGISEDAMLRDLQRVVKLKAVRQ